LDVSITIDNRLFAAAYELATGKELTDDEKKSGKKLVKDILKDEFLNQGGNIAASNKMVVKLPGDLADV
jgi:hypothetical protein